MGNTMEAITLGKLGTVEVVQPLSFSVVSDLCAEWNETATRAKLARLCAAAIGVCWDRNKNAKRPPLYDTTAADPIGYGGVVLDWLYKEGAAMSTVYEAGGALMSVLFGVIPTEDEVLKAEDFTEPGSEKQIA